MRKTSLLALAAASIIGTFAISLPEITTASSSKHVAYEPHLRASDFSTKINNRYFPLPVGRMWVYRGTKEGKSQLDRVTVLSKTKVVAEGITARVVMDVATHRGRLLEKTFDWYAQDKQGNVWYVGEDTTAYLPNGKTDTSGSWEAGVHDGEPGIVMEADPEIPDAYRQEFLSHEAEDTAWVVATRGDVTVPYGRFHRTLWTLEATEVEPGSYDLKVYAPGVGIIREQALTGEPETAELVSVSG
jgi:hypothetical protein